MRISGTIIFAAAGMIFAGSAAQACDWMHTADTATSKSEQKVAMSEAPSAAVPLVSPDTSGYAGCAGEKCAPGANRSATKSALTR
jgi:hypothetical protein